MRRVGRYMFGATAGLSLVLCAAAIVLLGLTDGWYLGHSPQYLLYSEDGRIYLWSDGELPTHVPFLPVVLATAALPAAWADAWLMPDTSYFVTSAWRWLRAWPARRRGGRSRRNGRSGFCAACRYDMRATPERCPECGADSTRRAS